MKMSKENNSLTYFFVGLMILLACTVCCFGIVGPIIHGNQADTIINQYEILQQDSISRYNSMLAKAQNTGLPINVPEFESNNNKTNFENYLAQNYDHYKAGPKLDELLTSTNNELTRRLENINVLISQKAKIDYPSLKVSKTIYEDKLNLIRKQS